MKYTGVTSRGIITPIFKQGDDLVKMICDSLLAAAEGEGRHLAHLLRGGSADLDGADRGLRFGLR